MIKLFYVEFNFKFELFSSIFEVAMGNLQNVQHVEFMNIFKGFLLIFESFLIQKNQFFVSYSSHLSSENINNFPITFHLGVNILCLFLNFCSGNTKINFFHLFLFRKRRKKCVMDVELLSRRFFQLSLLIIIVLIIIINHSVYFYCIYDVF